MTLKFNSLKRREHFIPLRKTVLLSELLKDPRFCDEERDRIEKIGLLLAHRYHFEYLVLLQDLLDNFAPFDPDSDTIGEPELTDEVRRDKGSDLIADLQELAEICNFTRFTTEEFNEILKLQPQGGLSVQVALDDFQSFSVFYRGVRPCSISCSKWWWFWKRNKQIETQMFSRVFIAAQLKNENNGNVIVKLFKDITKENLKIVAPKVKLCMPIFDRFKIGGTVSAGLFPSVIKLFSAAALSWWVFFVVLFGCCSAAVKAVFSFFNSKTKYMQIYSSSLYFQNLSNNSGAITAMMEMAERQEIQETVLGWFFLYLYRETPLTEKELDEKIERWFKEKFAMDFDFESDDALRKLSEKEIIQVHQGGSDEKPRYSVYDPLETLRRLDKTWDEFCDFPEPV